jgi:quinol monooxygenase YgiN
VVGTGVTREVFHFRGTRALKRCPALMGPGTLMTVATDDLADAVILLRQKRAAHVEQLKRIDAALSALTAVREESRNEPGTLAAKSHRSSSGPTTRQKVVALLNEDDRDWAVGEMIEEYEQRGDPFTVTNADSAIRAALVTAVQKDEIFRTDPGRYKSTKFKPVEHDPGSNGHSSREVMQFAADQD